MEDATYFAFSAVLRIRGSIEFLDEITDTLGLKPTHTHRRGEPGKAKSLGAYPDDGWHYKAPIPEDRPLTEHLDALWRAIEGNVDYLRTLKRRGLKVDVFCGYRSNCDHAGFEVEYRALRIFMELEIPFGVSVIIVS